MTSQKRSTASGRAGDGEPSGDGRPAARTGVAGKARELIGRNAKVNRVYRTSVGVVGTGVVVLGVALIPLPGPGSLIAVGGLAILGTEFAGAAKVSRKANSAVRSASQEVRRRRAAQKLKRQAASGE